MNSDFVLDASVALSWIFGDEQTMGGQKLLENLDQLKAIVPSLWPLEISNALVVSVRRGRIRFPAITEVIELYNSLNIMIDYETPDHGFKKILSLAYSENLSAYDAAYLELAMRLKLPLATLDKQLKQAATKLNVDILKT